MAMNESNGENLFWYGGCFFFGIGASCGLIIIAAGFFLWMEVVPPMFDQPVAQATIAVQEARGNATATPTAVMTIEPSPMVIPTAIPTPVPTPFDPPPLGLAVPDVIDQRPIPTETWQNLEILFAGRFPPRDFYETEDRLGNSKLRGRTVTRTPYNLGLQRMILVNDTQVSIRLYHASEHVLYWADPALRLTQNDMIPVAERLENDYYEPLVELLGVEPIPGIDGEPRFHIVHLANSTTDELGYFDSSDQFPREIFRNSNEHDAIYLNMAELNLGGRSYYGTLVHEIEHLLHWQSDPNETTWLDEGLAELTEVYFDLDTFSAIDYLEQPEIQLNSWSNEPEAIYAHYAGSGLLLVYFWEQLGDAAVRELFLHPADGLASMRAVLARYRPDSSLEEFMADFYAAAFIQDQRLDFWLPEQPLSQTVREPQILVDRLPQFGVHYISLDMTGSVSVSFAGDTLIDLYERPSPLSTQAWLAPAVNSLDATLTAEFDLRGLDQATLVYQTWYELEQDFDFAYVLVSADGGQTWRNLRPPLGEAGPFGRGYNGRSAQQTAAIGQWLDEALSLDAYVGQVVQIRFEVLTDAAIAERGFALNNLAVPELGAQGQGNWVAKGFVRTGSQLPQQWSIQLLRPNHPNPVIPLELDEHNQAVWRLELDQPAVLAIVPLTPMTVQEADYWVRIERE